MKLRGNFYWLRFNDFHQATSAAVLTTLVSTNVTKKAFVFVCLS